MSHRFVYIKWRDHFSQDGPLYEEELADDFVMETAGFLVRDHNGFIVVARDRRDDGKWKDVIQINKKLILEKKVLRRINV